MASKFEELNQRYIFAGGPGAGKTTVLNALSDRGFLCVSDHAREIIRFRKERGIAPRPEPVEFATQILKMDIEAFVNAHRREGPIFFERGIPDSLGMLFESGAITIEEVHEHLSRYPYSQKVFFFGPWADIYVTDAERDHSFSHALSVSELVKAWYSELGFVLVDVPEAQPEERVMFILKHVGAIL